MSNPANPGQPPPQPVFSIQSRPEVAEGGYANFANVRSSAYDITVDFVNMDFSVNQGVLVSRMSMSPMFAQQLTTALTSQIDLFASRVIEQEVGHGVSDGPEASGAEGDPEP